MNKYECITYCQPNIEVVMALEPALEAGRVEDVVGGGLKKGKPDVIFWVSESLDKTQASVL